ncbi:hypothetical protein AS4_08410 [Acinetobacter guillouiae]|uniref:NACHT domain-containing protein n=1 Tax=Acinetobacter guillouiae TaxID=106649 RepID=UPI0004EF6693|nr:hypothetical protein [Acinetobacter guillouiae]BAP35781.1 hypothetical protein AS4_08410 [Acinetobacter guillouiae]
MNLDQELFCLPQGEPPLPPIDTLEQTLPFDKLEWENFEKLIARIVSKEFAITDTYLYGVRGQDQSGLDILANIKATEKKACFQCKRVKTFNALDIKTAVNKFLKGKWAEQTQIFVLCITISMNHIQQVDEIENQKKILRQLGIDFRVWDATETGQLSQKLKNLPEIVDDFFGREWVKRFNGSEKTELLGDRANGYEINHLRDRLFKFYSTLFARHDPGLNSTHTNRSIDLRERYIPSDISEYIQRSYINLPIGNDQPKEDIYIYSNEENKYKNSNIGYENISPILEWILLQENGIIIGEPGLGKSAFLRYLTLTILEPITDNQKLNNNFFNTCVPIWISFSGFTSAIEKKEMLNIDDYLKDWLHQFGYNDVYPLFKKAIKTGNLLILLDGLDESGNEYLGQQAIDRVITFLESHNARIICTSRPQGYKQYSLPTNWKVGTLQYLDENKVLKLASTWFRHIEFYQYEEGEEFELQLNARSSLFLNVVKSNHKTFELAKTPLLCQALIELFHHRHALPEVRVKVYQQIIELLLTKHPKARAHAGGLLNKDVMHIRQDDIQNLLIKLAWKLQTADLHASTLSRSECKKIIEDYLIDDDEGMGEDLNTAKNRSNTILDFLVDQYAILVERSPKQYNFVHLSIQEYLAAEHVIRLSEADQLNWFKNHWILKNWHESILSWFGLLDSQGKKDLVSITLDILDEHGQNGEWQRLKSIMLQTELITSDLGVKIRRSRDILKIAINEIEISPFSEYRVNLAESIVKGSLYSKISQECRDIIIKWNNIYSPSLRRMILKGLKHWNPDEQLFNALYKAIFDEDWYCSCDAALSFATVFKNDERCIEILSYLAKKYPNPEVRAAAILALATQNIGDKVVLEVIDLNSSSNNLQVIKAVIIAKIKNCIQSSKDLSILLNLLQDQNLFREEHSLINIIKEGWPNDVSLKEEFISYCKKTEFNEHQFHLEYLVSQFPNDDTVAEIVCSDLENNKLFSFTMFDSILDELLAINFKNNVLIKNALLISIYDEMKEYKVCYQAYSNRNILNLIDDVNFKNVLISSYENEGGLHDKYWVVTALLGSWKDDEVVKNKIDEWIYSNNKDLAAPLSEYISDYIADMNERKKWLINISNEMIGNDYLRPVFSLIDNFKDNEVKDIIIGFIQNLKIRPDLRANLIGHLIINFPECKEVLNFLPEIFESANSNLEIITECLGDNEVVSGQLLELVNSSYSDVREIINSVIYERVNDFDFIKEIIPNPLLEYDGTIRTRKIMAYSKSAKFSSISSQYWKSICLKELVSIGTNYEQKVRSGIIGLIELEEFNEIENYFKSDKAKGMYADNFFMIDYLQRDKLASSIFLKNFDNFDLLFRKDQININEFINQGYEGYLERTKNGKEILDNFYLNSNKLNPLLKIRKAIKIYGFNNSVLVLIIQSLKLSPVHSLFSLNEQNELAKLLILNYRWSEVSEIFVEYLGEPNEIMLSFESGVLGWFAYGWNDSPFANWVRAQSTENLNKYSLTNRVFFAEVLNEPKYLEEVILNFVDFIHVDYKYYDFLREIFIELAGGDLMKTVLKKWVVSKNYHLISLSIELLKEKDRLDVDLIRIFNEFYSKHNLENLDGINFMQPKHNNMVMQLFSKIISF